MIRVFFILLFSVLPLHMAQAQSIGCNSAVMDSIEANAWLSAQRQTDVAQSLIQPGNIVSDMSCFVAPCNTFNAVWDAARCGNMDIDMFVTLEDWSSADYRGCGAAAPGWTGNLEMAGYVNPVPISDEVADQGTYSILDCAAEPPVPTGAQIDIDGALSADSVCLPGCYYNGSSCQKIY